MYMYTYLYVCTTCTCACKYSMYMYAYMHFHSLRHSHLHTVHVHMHCRKYISCTWSCAIIMLLFPNCMTIYLTLACNDGDLSRALFSATFPWSQPNTHKTQDRRNTSYIVHVHIHVHVHVCGVQCKKEHT